MEYVGIFGGLTLGILGWFFGREAARKRGGLDEMNNYIWTKARSTSWYFTAAAIYVLMTLELLGVELSIIPALSILLFVHLSSWAVAGLLYSSRLIQNVPNYTIVLSSVIFAFFLLFFVFVSLFTDNWKFLLAAIPPIVMNTIIMVIVARKAKRANPNGNGT